MRLNREHLGLISPSFGFALPNHIVLRASDVVAVS